MNPYTEIAYKTLGISEGVEVGEFVPGESEKVVEAVSDFRIEKLEELRRLTSVPIPSYHTYKDFCLQTERDKPAKKDYLPVGHSLRRGAATLESYLAYVRAHDEQLASWFSCRLNARIPESHRKRHTYILGMSGSGKTELLKILVNAYLRNQDFTGNVVVLDPHGDFAQEVAEWKGNGENLTLFDPHLKPGYTPVINPFELRKRTEQSVDALAHELLCVFTELMKSTGITLQMEALLIPCLAVLLWRDGSTLADLQRFMDDERNADLVALGVRSSNPGHRSFFLNEFGGSNFQMTKRSISARIQSLFNSRTFYCMTVGKSTVDLEHELNRRGRLIVFKLAKGDLSAPVSEAMGKFILALIQSYMPKRDRIQKAFRVPVHLFADEFTDFVSVSTKHILTQSRKWGLHMTLAQQYFGQGMDTDFRKSVMGNTAVKIMGMSSMDTMSAIAKETGVAVDDLQNLTVGLFSVRSGKKPAFVLHAPRFLLGKANSMSREAWSKVVSAQLEKHYAPITTPKVEDKPKDGFDMDL